MFGDHHVLAVRDALTKLDGIKEVYASSAWKQLMISFDPKKIKQSDIEKTLAKSGYAVGDGEPPILVETNAIKRDPQWELLGVRVTETNRADKEMSGEHRRY
jgi:copper chaperone CopZ